MAEWSFDRRRRSLDRYHNAAEWWDTYYLSIFVFKTEADDGLRSDRTGSNRAHDRYCVDYDGRSMTGGVSLLLTSTEFSGIDYFTVVLRPTLLCLSELIECMIRVVPAVGVVRTNQRLASPTTE